MRKVDLGDLLATITIDDCEKICELLKNTNSDTDVLAMEVTASQDVVLNREVFQVMGKKFVVIAVTVV